MEGKKSRIHGPVGPDGAKCSPKQIAWVRDILHSMDTPSGLEAKKRLRSSGWLLFCATLFFVIGAVMYLFSKSGVVATWISVPFFLASVAVCIYSSYRTYF